MTSTVHSLALPGIGPVDVTVGDVGAGPPVLLLHGGAGPLSVAGFAERYATTAPARVLVPTHPGFGGTPRPGALDGIAGLAALYAALLDRLELDDVTVVGNSIGGWIAAELALRGSRRIGRIVLVNAVGIQVEGHPVANVFALALDELMKLSYHDPAPFRVDPATLGDAQKAAIAANRAALAVYGGQPSVGDPTLRARLGAISMPALVLWGESDRVADPVYGRAYADAIPGARFQLLAATGHVPQIETPAQLADAIRAFVGRGMLGA